MANLEKLMELVHKPTYSRTEIDFVNNLIEKNVKHSKSFLDCLDICKTNLLLFKKEDTKSLEYLNDLYSNFMNYELKEKYNHLFDDLDTYRDVCLRIFKHLHKEDISIEKFSEMLGWDLEKTKHVLSGKYVYSLQDVIYIETILGIKVW